MRPSSAEEVLTELKVTSLKQPTCLVMRGIDGNSVYDILWSVRAQTHTHTHTETNIK